jgi:diadenosine tetraphosphatase ApaH/serine/threonine PP2A family protein phosphatase
MRVSVISDVHGNLTALEAVLAEVGERTLWCLGDVVGYGARPNECCALVRGRAALCLAGNHDLAVRGTIDTNEFAGAAGIAARWTSDVLDDESRTFLDSLESQATADGVELFHASARDPIWEYVLSDLAAELCLDASDCRINFIGHSHVALSFTRPEGEPAQGTTRKAEEEVELHTGEWLINPGSSGQPRDGDPRAAWLLLDTDRGTASWQRAEYDIAGAQAAIRAARLPDSLAERLQYGQ